MLDVNDELDNEVARIYATCLVEHWGARDARPDAENIADMRATIMRLSERLADDRNHDYAVYLIDIADDGGPALVFVNVVDDIEVASMFQTFDGNPSIMYWMSGGEEIWSPSTPRDYHEQHPEPPSHDYRNEPLTDDERRELDATNMHEPGPSRPD